MDRVNEYINLYEHIRKRFPEGLEITFHKDDLLAEYYITGNYEGNLFGIDINKDDQLSFTYYGPDKEKEEHLRDAITDFKGEGHSIDYTIRDHIDKDVHIRVYEWGRDTERFNQIRNGKTVDFPRYIETPRFIYYSNKKPVQKELNLGV